MTNIWGTPSYFVLLRHVRLDTRLFTAITARCRFSNFLYLVEFQAAGIELPSSEPIGICYYAGNRRFIWRDKMYSECDLHHRAMKTRISELITETKSEESEKYWRKVLDLLKFYSKAPAPNINSTSDLALSDPDMRSQKFVRAIYLID